MQIGSMSFGSGLDINGLVKQLMELERIPVNRLQEKKKYIGWRQEALNEFKTQLNNLHKKAFNLTLDASFKVKKATSTDDTAITATANGNAVNGSYKIEVVSLAKVATYTGAVMGTVNPAGTATTMTGGAELSSIGDAAYNALFKDGPGATGLSQDIQTGSFKINGVQIIVNRDTDTINTIINQINDKTDVKAEIVNDKIVLTSKTVGPKAITVSDDNTNFVKAAFLDTAGTPAPVTVTGMDPANKRTLDSLGVTSGWFTINGYTFSVNAAVDTLDAVIDKINKSSAGVNAYYDAATDKFTLSSKETGASAKIIVRAPSDTSNFLDKVQLPVIGVNTPNQIAVGSNAQVKINDGAIEEKTSNKFELNGVTFDLKKAGVTATITVKQDTDAIINSITDFINQYNTTIQWINSKLSENKVLKPLTDMDRKSGILRSEGIVRSAAEYLRSSIFDPVSGLVSTMDELAEIGITTGTVGGSDPISTAKSQTLQIDKDKLRAAIESNPEAVFALFSKGSVAVVDETITVDGTSTVYKLANKPVAFSPSPIITVNGTTWTLVSSNPTGQQYTINYNTGEITFGTAPAASDTVKVTYNYTVTSGSEAGIAVRVQNYIGSLTSVGGSLDAKIGTDGSISRELNYLDDVIENFEYRLKLREDQLYKQFNAMDRALALMRNQSGWLSAQMGYFGEY